MIDLSAAPVTLILLVLNVLVSGYALLVDASLIDRLAFKPQRILKEGEYYRMVSAGFVHAGIAHLAFNMITLYFFGPVLEYRLGPGQFLLLYFGSELAAHGLTLALKARTPGYAAIGASGAVSGVVFAFCLFYPLEYLYLFFALPIPAIVFAVGYVLISVYAMQNPAGQRGATGGIAHEAHVGGAIAGLIITLLMQPAALGIFLQQIGL